MTLYRSGNGYPIQIRHLQKFFIVLYWFDGGNKVFYPLQPLRVRVTAKQLIYFVQLIKISDQIGAPIAAP